MSKVSILNRLPTVAECKRLRAAVGWIVPPDESIERGLRGSIYGVSAALDDAVVGMGRIVGDRGFVYFVADVIVLPELQRQGIGTAVMDRLMAYIREEAVVGACVTLMAAHGMEGFYERFGFVRRPSVGYGSGMTVPPATVADWLHAR